MKTNPAGIPGVDRLLNTPELIQLIADYGRALVVDETRSVLGEIRAKVLKGAALPEETVIVNLISIRVHSYDDMTILPVVNATGVILHTNLGRAPLSDNAIGSMERVSKGYSTLEYDIDSGQRSKRTIHLEELFQKYLGVESAYIVNNNAAAVLVILASLAYRKKVIISRGQLVEIGGGFRVPDILKQSGAKLMEIGTTNQVHIEDYQKAIDDGGNIVLYVHPSNFKVTGFFSEPPLEEIIHLAHSRGIPCVEDLGSGALADTAAFGLAHEPTVQESIESGVDVVCFSGDKLMGGPQAGCILGKKVYMDRVKKHPLARVLRADKLLISSLEATLLPYIKGRHLQEIPVWKMISATPEDLKIRVDNWIQQLGEGIAVEGLSTIGGGSMPGEETRTWLLQLNPGKPDVFQEILRQQSIPVIARIQNNSVCFDPRTVFPEQDNDLISTIRNALRIYRQRGSHEKTN